MFFHNFKYILKTLLKNKALIFWIYAFPIILGTFFYMAFSNIESAEKLSVIKIAVIDNDEFKENIVFKESISSLSKGDNQIFDTKYVDIVSAKKLLVEGKISGYITVLNNGLTKIFVQNSGIEETILKYVVEEIETSKNLIEDISNTKIAEEINKGNFNFNPEEVYTNVSNKLSEQNINIKDISKENLSYVMIEFYTLIAMTCLYAGMFGMVAINNSLANTSDMGKRVSVSPMNKFKLITSSLLASYIVQIIGIVILFAYTILVLNVDYGTDILKVILLSLVGTFFGLSFGVCISSIFNISENTKTGVMISLTMAFCFFSGMMGPEMKYIVDTKIPLLNKINPVAMITDGFYSLYYYNGSSRYMVNLISLGIFSLVLVLISFISIRRQKHDSI